MTLQMDSIVSHLPNMSASDLAKIKQLTDLLLTGTQEQQVTVSDPAESILFEAVKAELSSAGVNGAIGYASFSQSKFHKSWKRGVKVVAEFIDCNFDNYVKTDAHRLGICRILVQTIISEFRQRSIPISIGTISNNLHRVPQTFERAFPGYLRSGLAYLIVASLVRTKKSA